MSEKSVRVRRRQPAAPEAAQTLRPAFGSEDVAIRAYHLFLARGCEHGHDWEDWLAAERELATLAAAVVPPRADGDITLRTMPERRRKKTAR